MKALAIRQPYALPEDLDAGGIVGVVEVVDEE